MEEIIYIASDGSGMIKGDVVSWVKYCKQTSCIYSTLSFDDITGGFDEFLSLDGYYAIKLECKPFFTNE